jgi:hypothetical protein
MSARSEKLPPQICTHCPDLVNSEISSMFSLALQMFTSGLAPVNASPLCSRQAENSPLTCFRDAENLPENSFAYFWALCLFNTIATLVV